MVGSANPIDSSAFDKLHKIWDLISLTMLKPEHLLNKPISLRHPYVFYIGHLPVFCDIQLSRACNIELTSPKWFTDIFERGIDPDVDNPDICHSHSLVPDTWPEVSSILRFRDAVRDKLKLVLKSPKTKRIERVLAMVYEHDAMHIETFLYMLVQDPQIQPPLNVAKPVLRAASESMQSAEFLHFSGGNVRVGVEDTENNDFSNTLTGESLFAWDNESPSHMVNVYPFEIQHRPVTVSEYLAFFRSEQNELLLPSNWKIQNSDEYCVKTVFGLIPICLALDWPVFVSYEQAEQYAKSQGARLPTEYEIMYIRTKQKDVCEVEVNNFQTWLPTSVKSCANHVTDLNGQGWELTSSDFGPYPGFIKSKIYPGYSSEFFDGKHNVVLGGSWATVDRIANRVSFRNWFQKNYQYVFSKFRLVKMK